MVASVPTKEKDQLLSSMIKRKDPSKEVKNSSIMLSQRSGKSLKVIMNPSNEPKLKPVISTNVMEDIQTSFGFTQNETLGIATIIRVGSSNPI